MLTQYKAQSLIRQVARSGGFLKKSLGEYTDIVRAQQQVDDGGYSGTAHAVFQKLTVLRDAQAA